MYFFASLPLEKSKEQRRKAQEKPRTTSFSLLSIGFLCFESCLLNEKARIIERQNRKIDDLRHDLNEEEYRNEQLLDKIEELRNELSIALDAKSYYKHKSQRNKKVD